MNGVPLILCIDDEELGLRIRRVILERAGYQVLTAPDGKSGLERFSAYEVNAVVLDYSMPEMNGLEVAQAMRCRKSHVPILLLSAYVELPTEATALVDATLMKGAGPQDLVAAVQRMVDASGLSSPPPYGERA